MLAKGFVDGRKMPEGTTFEADICIIGAGPVGITLAEQHAADGLTVCLIESGGFDYDAEVHELCRGEIAGDGLVDPHKTRLRQFGGLSSKWHLKFDPPRLGVRYAPFDAIDMIARNNAKASAWPFSREALQPWYERAHEVCEIGPFGYQASERATADAPALTSDCGELETTLFLFGPRDRFCTASRKTLAASGRVQTVLHTSALSIDVSPGEEHVKCIRLGCLNGRRHQVRARAYVLAAGGLENARLMLLSDAVNPAGVGNGQDLVGRYLMDHPLDSSSLIEVTDPSIYDRLHLFDMHARDGVGFTGKLTFTPEAIVKNDLIAMSFLLLPCEATQLRPGAASLRSLLGREPRVKTPAGLAGRIGAIMADPISAALHLRRLISHPGIVASSGSGGWSRVRDKGGKFAHIDVYSQVEQYPRADNRAVLGRARDAFGQRCIRLEFSWNADDQARFARSRRFFAEKIQNMGWGRLKFDDSARPTEISAHHHMGTTRMDPDPVRGVVDADCRVHGMDNLFVGTASVFPTGSYANPTLTAIALALRLADHLSSVVPSLHRGE